MIVIILASALILGIAVYQAHQGTFSAMIMAILTILCAVVALNFYEPVGQLLVGRLAAYAEPVALLALFALPLLILREVFDRCIRGNVLLGLWPDRLGGAAFGLLAGIFLTGMLMIVVQLLPLPGTFFGYQPYDSTLQPARGGPPKWAEGFVLGTAKLLSGGSMQPIGEGRRFGVAHEDLRLESFCIRNRPPGARAWAPANAMTVTNAFLVPPPPKDKGPRTYTETQAARAVIHNAPAYLQPDPEAGTKPRTKLVLIRVRVNEMPPEGAEEWHYQLPATHFRLITQSGKSYYPVAYLTRAGSWRLNAEKDEHGVSKTGELVVVRPWKQGTEKQSGGPKRLHVDWVYRLGAEEIPQAMLFRRSSWDDVGELIDAVFDTEMMRLALGVKAARNETKFTVPDDGVKRLLQPARMSVSATFGDTIVLRVQKQDVDNNSAVFKRFKRGPQNRRVQVAKIYGTAEDLAKGPAVASEFLAPVTSVVVRIECKVDTTFDMRTKRASLPKFAPRALVSDGTWHNHSGAYMTYADGRQNSVAMYYTNASGLAGRPRPIDAEFARKLLNNVPRVKKLVFVFILPKDDTKSLVKFELDPGADYTFNAPTPLLLWQR